MVMLSAMNFECHKNLCLLSVTKWCHMRHHNISLSLRKAIIVVLQIISCGNRFQKLTL